MTTMVRSRITALLRLSTTFLVFFTSMGCSSSEKLRLEEHCYMPLKELSYFIMGFVGLFWMFRKAIKEGLFKHFLPSRDKESLFLYRLLVFGYLFYLGLKALLS